MLTFLWPLPLVWPIPSTIFWAHWHETWSTIFIFKHTKHCIALPTSVIIFCIFSCEDAALQVLMSECVCVCLSVVNWSRMSQNAFKMFQNVPECYRMHVECSRMFQNACRMFQMVQECMQNVPECYRINAECSRMFQNWCRMFQNASRMFLNVPECMQNVQECMQNVQECLPECSRMHAEFSRMHAECSTMHAECSKLHANLWACMQVYELACNYISLHAVT